MTRHHRSEPDLPARPAQASPARGPLPNAPALYGVLFGSVTVCAVAGLLVYGVVGFLAGLAFAAVVLPVVAGVATRLTGLQLARDVDDVIALRSGTVRPMLPGAGSRDGPRDRPPDPRGGFWQALTAEEQRALREVAREQTFAPGQALCLEGDRAAHVIVIMAGWVKVFVVRDGHERILALRGGGDLVGERAAFEVRSRSASLVALDSVPALLVSTADFVAFVGVHPRVLDVIEEQVYARLTEEPGRSLADETADAEPRIAALLLYLLPEHGEPGPVTLPISERLLADWAGTSPVVVHAALTRWRDKGAVRAGADAITVLDQAWLARIRDDARHPALPPVAAPHWTGQNCTILMVDIAGFGDPVRSDADRRSVRASMYRMLRECFEQAGLQWAACHREDRGDGALFIVPPSTPTAQVAERLTGRLAEILRPYNHAASQALRLQLRAAVDVGPVITDADGVTGDAIVRAARLLDAPAFKKQMSRAGADLGVITSEFVYDSVLRHDPAGYRRIRVQVKEADLPAWIRVTGDSPLRG